MRVTPPGDNRPSAAAEPSTKSKTQENAPSIGSAAARAVVRGLRIHRRNVPCGRQPVQRGRRVLKRVICAGFAALVMCVAAASPVIAAPHVVALAASLTVVLDNIRNWLVGLLASLATVFFTVGGVRYLAADGDPGEIGKAKQAFKSAALGYALAALAPILVAILKGIVGTE